jgi:hypothetical protein
MKDRYVSCYVSGRCDTFEGEVDMAMLVAKIQSGASPRETVLALARKTITDEMNATLKVQWLKDNLDEIKELGGDTEKAWRQFCEGRVDALAKQLDEEAMEELMNQLEEEEDEDEDEEDGDDEEGDDDEDDDAEDDDDEDEE